MTTAWQWIATDFGGPEVLQLRMVDVPSPGPGEVTITVRAAGMNPADYKHFGPGQDHRLLPLTVGYEVAGVLAALGPGASIPTGGAAVGDEVIAFRIGGGYASALNARASDVFAKPGPLDFAQAANLLLAGTTAAELLATAAVVKSDTVLLHGAAGAVGLNVLQQARLIGVRVIGTASPDNFGILESFGAVPVPYGDGPDVLAGRVRGAAPEGVTAVLDTVGTDEAVDGRRRKTDRADRQYLPLQGGAGGGRRAKGTTSKRQAGARLGRLRRASGEWPGVQLTGGTHRSQRRPGSGVTAAPPVGR
jgi:NADPH2:quinone reductase